MCEVVCVNYNRVYEFSINSASNNTVGMASTKRRDRQDDCLAIAE